MGKDTTVVLRNLRVKDYDDISEAMKTAYSGIAEATWNYSQLKKLINLFPEGQICIEVNERVVACALSIIVDYIKYGDSHTFRQITGNEKFSTHDPEGDVLYGIDIFVHPEYRNMRLGRRLYDARKELCENFNLRAIIAGGRIPGYQDYADEYTPKHYIEKVEMREIYDPILTFQISNNFHVKKILRNYLPIAGCVGNLPKVNNMDIQYAQSAVFSPSDFAFPTNAVVSEATPNTEMMVIADVNLDLLKELHVNGSVRNLKDRRNDLYSLKWKNNAGNIKIKGEKPMQR